jgi:signal transduction histidine kinase
MATENGYRHPLCKDLKVIPTADVGEWEDLVDHGPAPVEPQTPARGHKEEPAPQPKAMNGNEKEKKMAAYMTHELRAPLTSIRSALGILEMQLGSRLSAEERQILNMATRNSDRLDSLINDIMDFSKVRAGKMDLKLSNLQPEEVLQEAIESLRSWAVAKGIRVFRVESDEPMPLVRADRQRTLQVITNLLSNAIKFTPAGGKIEVSTQLGRFEHLGTVVLRVKDSGPGVPASELGKIFASFEQSALGAKQGTGTGLGLTLAKAMVELMGGRIWAESWKGLGAMFQFTLPIMSGDPKAKVQTYPQPARYGGILVNVYKRLNAVVAALFS